MKKSQVLVVILIVFTIAAALHVFDWLSFFSVSDVAMQISRWAFMTAVFVYACLKRSLTTWIFTGMGIGVLIGLDFPEFSQHLKFLNTIFLRMIKTVIAPLLFGTLVVGIATHSDLKQIGKMAWKSLLYFEVVTTFALVIGLAFINLTGAGMGIEVPDKMLKDLPVSNDRKLQMQVVDILEKSHVDVPDNILQVLPDASGKTWDQHIIDIFPENIVKSIYEGNVLPIVVFSLIFGIALAQLPDSKKRPMLQLAESLSETMFKFVNIIMYFAPFGVGAAIAVTVGHLGIDILKNLLLLLLTLYLALMVFVLLVLVPVALWNKIPIRQFIKAAKEPVSIAFATTSSDAALPIAMENMNRFGVSKKVVSFVIPTGYTFNLDGTTLYLSLAAVFVAQAAGIHLSIWEQLMICLTLVLTSKGVAAVPRASLVILIATASTFNLPIWPIMAIYGIDELMDMARTSVNVTGNMLASCVVSRWENEFDDEKALKFEEE
ncbi:MAG: sodium:dicarboxylate symporter [Bacteroidetes bacterium]|jgi:proton glutamate symport protein|nr:sodium:dicarboxylate symporter [Bacteroidota bacterium]